MKLIRNLLIYLFILFIFSSISLLAGILLLPELKISFTDKIGQKSGINDLQFQTVETLAQIRQSEILKIEVKKILGNDLNNFGIYAKDMNSNKNFLINADKTLPPASISKVPVAIKILEMVEEGEITLEDEIEIVDSDNTWPSNILSFGDVGNNYKVWDLMGWMIIDSDNIALRALERIAGGNLVMNDYTREKLGVDLFFRDPHECTARNIGLVFEGIYNETYLPENRNDQLLDLLLRTAPSLQEEIPEGLPANTPVAHKTGRLYWEQDLFSINDAGIVYGENTDFVIVFINQEVKFEESQEKIAEITGLIYEWMEGN